MLIKITDQKLLLMSRFQHGRHFLQVSAIVVFIQVRQEEDRDDPLGDVDQVEIITALHDVLHHAIHAVTPLKRRK